MRAMLQPLAALFHEPRWRVPWRVLLGVLAAVTAVFAFSKVDPILPFVDADKFNHLLAFGSMAFAASCAQATGSRAWRSTMLGALGYGGFIELVQSQIPGRQASWADLAADLAGAALGIALVAALRRWWPREALPPG